MRKVLPYSVTLRSREISGGRKCLYLDVLRSGKRSTESLHLFLEPETRANKRVNEQTMAEAMQMRQLRENELKETVLGIDLSGDGYGTSVYAFIEDEMERRKVEGKSVRLLVSLLVQLRAYNGTGDLLFCDVNVRWCQGFRMHLLTAKRAGRYGKLEGTLSKSSAATYYARFRTIMKLALRRGLIRRNPLACVDGIGFDETERKFLTREELRRMMDAPCEHEGVKRAFLWSCMTGMRYSDVAALRWRNIVRMEGNSFVRFRQKKTDAMMYELPLSKLALEQLPEDGEADGLVFDVPANTHCNVHIKRWCEVAGVTKHITFHCARHTFATGLLTSGTDLYTTSKLLGHKSIVTTQIYGKIVDEKRRTAVDALDKFLGGK